MGVRTPTRELLGEDRSTLLSVDASACKEMLFCTCAGKAKHLKTKQLLVQGAIQSYGVEVKKDPLAEHASVILTYPVGESGMKNTTLLRSVWDSSGLMQCWVNPCGIHSLGRRDAA